MPRKSKKQLTQSDVLAFIKKLDALDKVIEEFQLRRCLGWQKQVKKMKRGKLLIQRVIDNAEDEEVDKAYDKYLRGA